MSSQPDGQAGDHAATPEEILQHRDAVFALLPTVLDELRTRFRCRQPLNEFSVMLAWDSFVRRGHHDADLTVEDMAAELVRAHLNKKQRQRREDGRFEGMSARSTGRDGQPLPFDPQAPLPHRPGTPDPSAQASADEDREIIRGLIDKLMACFTEESHREIVRAYVAGVMDHQQARAGLQREIAQSLSVSQATVSRVVERFRDSFIALSREA